MVGHTSEKSAKQPFQQFSAVFQPCLLRYAYMVSLRKNRDFRVRILPFQHSDELLGGLRLYHHVILAHKGPDRRILEGGQR